jgi:hypothetical protein
MRQHGATVIYARDRDFDRYDGIDPLAPCVGPCDPLEPCDSCDPLGQRHPLP